VPTDAELLLWRRLRRRQVEGQKFRRQHAVGPYVLDFFCHERGLAIEVDGSQHMEMAAEDLRRTRYLATLGIKVMRFTNHEVLTETDAVLEAVSMELRADPSP
jgi:very-short-patch-repair endonuclease